ncbi:sulfotransferase family cytosolic 1B member 1-like [Mizuhopecten yessoensis]|uniref:Sulfotransferase family cytosolic 1B member 1 n=1 Tax=Mizuhopecten yessoensis TaxID=6573 RepID=A0A210PFB9_MIZYE|nr:sulfotransferase family cytosolic 1B member 1-like [Mizuhopecten yessoensis]XP_021343065.1 sulfotransferase family cytosolic 1B member 1-like [Mizuhopecten yessoensis]OWF35184.1 Sulfotransferase family cytosolic 1B member 1 [Mizuhopecten yessoensis]
MPVVRVPDEAGHTLTLLEVDGTYRATSRSVPGHENEIRSIPTWQARDDDVLICSYPKSGTHWIWEVVSMLMRSKAERVPGVKESAMLELIPQSRFDNLPSPRVLNTHLQYGQVPKDMLNRRCKILYMIRNPKDISVSFFNHHTKLLDYEFTGSWEQYLPRFLRGDVDCGSWFDFTLSWENFIVQIPDYPILAVYFEDMKNSNPLREIERIAAFLEVPCDVMFLERVAQLCNFNEMKRDKEPLEDAEDWRDGKPDMYRKGVVGDWKNWFTVGQNDLFDKVFSERMKNSQTNVRFS